MMQLSKSVFLLLMLVVCLFFISLSAFSGEHPWDSEGGGNNNDSDTSYNGESLDSITFRGLMVDMDESRSTGSTLSLSSSISIMIYNFFYDEIEMEKTEKFRRVAYPKRTFRKNYTEKF